MTPEILPARSLLPDLPENLPGLLFLHRMPVGPAVRLAAVGDVGLSGRVKKTAGELGYRSLFSEVEAVLGIAAVAFGNLETPLVDSIPPGSLFAASPEAATHLHGAGFTLLNVANNHILDYGTGGLSSTISSLRDAGLLYLGAGRDQAEARRLLCLELATLKVGFLACGKGDRQRGIGPCYWEFDECELTRAVIEARKSVDFLVVSIHIGFMYLDYPHPAHKRIAERLVAHGADLVLMHHAHVLQGLQIEKGGGLICYNLGNFLFDWREGNVEAAVMVEEQQEGAVFLFDFDREGICQAAVIPTFMDGDCRVRWALAERGEKILKRLLRISANLGGALPSEFRRQNVERNTPHALRVLWFHTRKGNWRYVADSLGRVRPHHAFQVVLWSLRAVRNRLRI